MLHSPCASPAEDELLELVIVGAGPHALSLLTRVLDPAPDPSGDFFIGLGSHPKSIHQSIAGCFPSARELARLHADTTRLMRRVRVIDPAGTWLARWDKQFRGLRIPHLRSPYDLHPAPYDSFALQAFVEQGQREDELVGLDHIDNSGQYRQGSFRVTKTRLFLDFCEHLVHRYGIGGAVTPGAVARVEPVLHAPHGIDAAHAMGHGGDGGDGGTAVRYFNVHVRGTGAGEEVQILRAKRVVLAIGGTRTRRIPDWALGMLPRRAVDEPEDEEEREGEGEGGGGLDAPPGRLLHAWDLLDSSNASGISVVKPGRGGKRTKQVAPLLLRQRAVALHREFRPLFAATFSLVRNARFIAALDKVAAMCGVHPTVCTAADVDTRDCTASVASFTMSVMGASIHGWKQALTLLGGQAQGATAASVEGGDGTSQADVTKEWSDFADAVSALENAMDSYRSKPGGALKAEGEADAQRTRSRRDVGHESSGREPISSGPSPMCVSGERVLVVGGGLTSAHLVRAALEGDDTEAQPPGEDCESASCKHGTGAAHVTLVSRSAIQLKQFDLSLEWVGWRHRPTTLSSFLQCTSADERLGKIRDARGGGSITPEAMSYLRSAVANGSGRLQILEETNVEAIEWEDGCWRVYFDRDVVRHDSGVESSGGECGANGSTDWVDKTCACYDRIWLATGSVLDANNDALLGPLLKALPPHLKPELVGGLPCLHPSLMLRQNVPCFVMGGYASLELGPDALNLAGGRAGACRVATVLRDAVRHAAGLDVDKVSSTKTAGVAGTGTALDVVPLGAAALQAEVTAIDAEAIAVPVASAGLTIESRKADDDTSSASAKTNDSGNSPLTAGETAILSAMDRLRVSYNHKSGFVAVSVCKTSEYEREMAMQPKAKSKGCASCCCDCDAPLAPKMRGSGRRQKNTARRQKGGKRKG